MKRGIIFLCIFFLFFILISASIIAADQCSEGYLDNYKCSGNMLQREYQAKNCQKLWKDFEDCSKKSVCPLSGNTFYQYSCSSPFLGLGTASCKSEPAACPEDKKCAVWGCAPKEKGFCKDGTEFNKCSTASLKGLGKPKYCQNGVLIDKCSVCGCEQGDCLSNGKCAVRSKEQEIINKPPVTTNPSPIYLTTEQENLLDIVELPVYASDPEGDSLEFYFKDAAQFISGVIDCTLSEDFRLSCQKPKQEGKVTIPIIVSDRKSSSEIDVEIEVFPPSAFSDQGEIMVEGIGSPPKADAGQDFSGFPNQKIILDGSASYDRDNDISSSSKAYEWYYNKEVIGNGRIFETRFPSPGRYVVFLKVTDSKGLSSTDKVIITISQKKKCKNTETAYFPPDTSCNKKWPSHEGDAIDINSLVQSCDLFEICDNSIDYIIDDAIACCKGQELSGNKKSSCDYAVKYSRSSTKKCYGLYIIQSLGGNAVYMNDYFEAEMCCYGEETLCMNPSNLFKPKPMPNSRFDLSDMRCYTTKTSGKETGKWVSDTKLVLNNIALSDIPAHVSLNILGTGTCVDYSASLTTLFRKAGYKKNEIYTVETPVHAYNLVRFPYDRKYTVVDTTGNNDPAVVFGKTPSSGQNSFDYCSNIKKCYNDEGITLCPSQSGIYGCENVKVSIARKSYYAVLRVRNVVGSLINSIKEAV